MNIAKSANYSAFQRMVSAHERFIAVISSVQQPIGILSWL